MSTALAIFVAAAVAANATPPAPPAPAQAPGLREDSTYLLLSPGVLALDLRHPDFRMYAWGVSAGRLFTGAGRFAAMLGGFFEHNLWVNRVDPDRGDRAATLSYVRLGGEARVGGSSDRVFGYGLVRLGADTLQFHEYYFLMTGGAGIMGALTPSRRLLLGGEPAVDFSVPEGLALVRVRVFVGVRF